jgi:hypothetical protein
MSFPAKRSKLCQNEIHEIIWDNDSDEGITSSDSSFEDEEDFEDQPEVSHLQPECPTSSMQISSGSISASASQEEDVVQIGPGQQAQMPSTSWIRPPSLRTSVVHMYTEGKRGKKDSKAPHISDSSSPLSVFLLYFAEMITLLVAETNRYYHDQLDSLDEEPLLLPDMTEAEVLVFLAITIQM